MTTVNRRNINVAPTAIASMFRDQKRSLPVGYANEEGGAEGTTGDSEAPFIKEPPFPTDAIQIVDRQVIVTSVAVGAEYAALPSIQCRQYRLLQIYIAYTMAVGGRLSLIPEAFVNGVWYNTTLVGAAVATITPTGTRFSTGGFGSRALEPVELRTDVLTAGTSRFTLTFDVTDLEEFRLNALDLTVNVGNTLRMLYALSV